MPKLLVGRDLEGFEERRDRFTERGVPDQLAEHVAMMVARGTGKVYYGYAGLYVTIIELDGTGSLSVEADRPVAHDAALQPTVV